MKIIQTRRLTQFFFFGLLVWFCVVSTVGERWHELRGWPINWLLQLDPLVALGTTLSTGRVYAGLLWAVPILVLTLFLGRVFCGWICPFGTLHQFIGWATRRGRVRKERIGLNQYHPAQVVKYYLLAGLLVAAAFGSLQTGLLDPIPLLERSFNTLLLAAFSLAGAAPRVFVAAWSILIVFATTLGLNLWRPRFFCRFLCPLGALFGFLVRWSPWRIGKVNPACSECERCEDNCEGACAPFGKFRVSECLLCMNCLDGCRQKEISYGPHRSAAGEVPGPTVTRRGFLAAALAGAAAGPAAALNGARGAAWNSGIIRPPGALREAEFLDRCIKCGQCIRVCPTNVLQPALGQGGLEGLWTPLLNYRAGSSGCQLNCIACGNVCPTAAIRPITLDEKLGRGSFADTGPLRLGTAFVDHSRCLPWAMGTPCIVCQENCPVSPKAIYVREEFQLVRDGARAVQTGGDESLTLDGPPIPAGQFATGDYYLRMESAPAPMRRRILESSGSAVRLASTPAWPGAPEAGERVLIEVRLQQPVIDLAHCIGCGVCEHECPVSGMRGIRITAENESRNPKHSLTARH